MPFELSTAAWNDVAADWLIVPVNDPVDLSGRLADLDGSLGGAIGRLKESGDLTGANAELVPLRSVTGIAARRALIVGLGKSSDLDGAKFDRAIMAASRETSSKKETRVAVAMSNSVIGSLGREAAVQSIATALSVGSATQALYRAEPGRFPFVGATILAEPGQDESALHTAMERGQILGQAINLARELVNRGPHEIYPESFADRARQAAADFGLGCEVLDEGRLRHERFGSMLAVAQGSTRPARLVILDYRGGPPGGPVLALVGKGVTFDSGGLSLKPTDGMLTMKCDMAGAATVLAAVTAVARLKRPVNVQGYMGLVENMVSGSSYKLGDVLTARNGVTIEVHNTDAEGRLVLADVLSYAVDHGVDRIVDLATLTGACVVALGEDIVGAFTNNQSWCDQILGCAKSVGEEIWQMPMNPHFAELIKSDVADIKNVGPRWGGAITAAKFLERFVGDKPWVHLDIAGPAFASSAKPYRDGGATGVMVKTLVDVAQKFGA